MSQKKLQDMLLDDMYKLTGGRAVYHARHLIFELFFLKRMSEIFEARQAELLKSDEPERAEMPEAYLSEDIFWIPEEARWTWILKSAQMPMIGENIDRAMRALELANEPLRGMLSHNYASPELDQNILKEIVIIVSKLRLRRGNLGDNMFLMDMMS